MAPLQDGAVPTALTLLRNLEDQMKVKISELIGPALDWAVASVTEMYVIVGGLVWVMDDPYQPSTNWSQGGPIIEREKLDLYRYAGYWGSNNPSGIGCEGPTPLIAAMRCFVASKLGDEVDVSEELLG